MSEDKERIVVHKNELFDKIIDEALCEISQKGVNGVSDKTVTIACVAILARNSIESLTQEVHGLKAMFLKLLWVIIPALLAFVVGVVFDLSMRIAGG